MDQAAVLSYCLGFLQGWVLSAGRALQTKQMENINPISFRWQDTPQQPCRG